MTSGTVLRQAWSARNAADTGAVRAFVKKLRGKLSEDAAKTTFKFNKRGVGYRMAKSKLD